VKNLEVDFVVMFRLLNDDNANEIICIGVRGARKYAVLRILNGMGDLKWTCGGNKKRRPQRLLF